MTAATGVRLEIVTVAWMTVEAAVAVGAGIAARSVLLTAFGLDSAIELASGATLLWRLSAEARGAGAERVERVERAAVRLSAVLLVLLCAALLGTAAAGLAARVEPSPSWLGAAVSAAALLGMPLLAWRKAAVNRTLRSPALRADIAETLACAWMAAAALAGVGLNLALGWWWAEYAAALALLVLLAREAREAVEAARE